MKRWARDHCDAIVLVVCFIAALVAVQINDDALVHAPARYTSR